MPEMGKMGWGRGEAGNKKAASEAPLSFGEVVQLAPQ